MVDEYKNNCQDNASYFSIIISNNTALLSGFKAVIQQPYVKKWKNKH